MAKLLITLKLDAIRLALSEADGIDHTEAEVLQWLQDAGFTRAGQKWIVSEADIGQVQPAEVEDIEVLPPDVDG